ncbi:hypothetical protein M422DRAFT_257378 [Sphaerobolus stellatus SS14]|uniref:NACHT domain-containing protein n=1 Tax=Sphaerobolus stellatus (strain SS14) TaxID=990650 RepID=A0A0C9VEF3_SPHS4|nr:hypothetical protein M422DRAFT_257378 [Sphaerobolus stellatus SS14]
MDPLSITTATIGFLGTLNTLGNIAWKIVTAEKEQKKAIEELNGQIQYFDRLLSDLHSLIEALPYVPGNFSQDYSMLETCLQTCHAQVQEFSDNLTPSASRWKGITQRFKWPLRDEERNKLVGLVDRYRSSIHLELTMKQCRDMQATAVTVRDESDHKEILKWLDVIEVNPDFDKAREKCHPGTGQWFLQSEAFEKFKGVVGKCLWLHGIPGCGKTIISGSIIAALRSHVESKPRTGLAYFFFSYTDKAKQNTFNMLSSIAAQLCQRITKVPPRVVTLHDNNKLARPPLSVVSEIITYLAWCFHQTYIVLDALDEIEVDERNSLLKALQEIIANTRRCNINVLMTSRREIYLADGFQSLSLEEISLTSSKVDEDISRYVTEIVEEEPKLSRWSAELRTEIVHTLRDKAKGMFRWVDCQIESLKKCRRAYDIKQTLGSLPKTLDETYKRILLAVEEDDRVYVARLLAFIVFTSEPLRLEVLAKAIAFEPDMSELDPDRRFVDPKDILGFCSNFLSSYQDNRFPRRGIYLTLSHYSVQEYLLSRRMKSDADLLTYRSILEHGPSYIMDVYVKYCRIATLQCGRLPLRCGRLPAHLYGHCNCLQRYPILWHSLDSIKNEIRIRSRSLIDEQKWQQLEEQFAQTICEDFSVLQLVDHLDPSESNHLVYLAQNGFVYGVKLCIMRGCDVNTKLLIDGLAQTPLSHAMRAPKSRRLDITTLLLEHGATDVIEVDLSGHIVTFSCIVRHWPG